MIRTTLTKRVFPNTFKRSMSTTTSTQNAEFDKKLEHYRNLSESQESDAKPSGWFEAKPFESIPGPKPVPILGNAWRFLLPKYGDFYGKDMVDVFKSIHKQYGDIAMLGGIRKEAMVMLFNPKDFETLFRNEGVWPIRKNQPSLVYFQEKRKDEYKNFSLLAHQGEPWFKIRSAANPILMKPKNIAQYADKMDHVAKQLVDNITYFATQYKGQMPSNFTNELYKWALESVAVVTLDTHLGCLERDLKVDSEPQKMINSALRFFQLMFKLDMQPSLYHYISTSDWREYVKVLEFMIGTNIKHVERALDRLASEPSDDDSDEARSVLQQLLQKDRDIAVAMAIDMMLAGIDTTGRVLGATLYFLARNPEVQEKLRSEAKTLLEHKNSPITKEVLRKASYLRAVIKEATRLAPIGIGNTRTTVKNLVLAGYQIPKGTDVIATNLILCQMDEHFPRASEFLPERWLSKAPADISHTTANPFVSLPFGFGPRSCIGKRLATLELQVATLKIIRNFELGWPHEDMVFATTALYGIDRPLKLHVKAVDQ